MATALSQAAIRDAAARRRARLRIAAVVGVVAAVGLVGGVLVWQALAAGGAPDPLAVPAGSLAAILNTAVLVFREGLECVLVLAAVTAGKREAGDRSGRAIGAGAAAAAVATLLTWEIAVRVLSDLGADVSALKLQAVTGLLAIVVLLVVMNWFFHRIYWTGWITLHTEKKRRLLQSGGDRAAARRYFWGFALLGFTSLYREGFEVVLFLQGYRLRLGDVVVGWGAFVGVVLAGLVAVLTFALHRRLPYRKMLVSTGVLLGLVLAVMVGEQAQEMQLAHWLPTTNIAALQHVIPNWMGLWFSIFPTVETLAAQALAIALVLGSYWVARD